MIHKQINWFRLIEPEDTSTTGFDGRLNVASGKNEKRYFALAKFLLWYGAGVSLSLFIAKFH